MDVSTINFTITPQLTIFYITCSGPSLDVCPACLWLLPL